MSQERQQYFDNLGNFTGNIPDDCVSDCTHSGSCDGDVDFWQQKLDFQVPRSLAIPYIKAVSYTHLRDWDSALSIAWANGYTSVQTKKEIVET